MHRLRTVEGAAVFECFDLIRSQMRVGPMGPVGLDMPAALDVLAACGLDRSVAVLLLPAVEAGLLDAIAQLRDRG